MADDELRRGLPIRAAWDISLRAAKEGVAGSAARGNTVTVESPATIRIDNPDGAVLLHSTLVLGAYGVIMHGNGRGSLKIVIGTELTWEELVELVGNYLPPAEPAGRPPSEDDWTRIDEILHDLTRAAANGWTYSVEETTDKIKKIIR